MAVNQSPKRNLFTSTDSNYLKRMKRCHMKTRSIVLAAMLVFIFSILAQGQGPQSYPV